MTRGLRALALATAMAVAAGACTADGDGDGGSDGGTTTTAIPASADETPGFQVVLTDVSELVEEVNNGVVSVARNHFRFGLEDILQSDEVRSGVGTGIVIDDDGNILTNFHVIAGAQAITITSRDGSEFEATIVGEAPDFDLALLRVEDPSGLEPIALGSSDDLDVGDPVVAIGNALGLDDTAPTVSVGIVSAQNRTLRAPDGTVLQGLLQTDAAINPGNSGGPLLNARGEVVGVNTAIVGSAQNLGFAISIDSARPIVEQFLSGQGGPFLGVQLSENSPRLAAQLRLATDRGAIVAAVTPGPALTAGVLPGDVIIGAGDIDVDDADDLIDEIAATGIGNQLALRILRGAELVTVTVEIGQRPVLVS